MRGYASDLESHSERRGGDPRRRRFLQYSPSPQRRRELHPDQRREGLRASRCFSDGYTRASRERGRCSRGTSGTEKRTTAASQGTASSCAAAHTTGRVPCGADGTGGERHVEGV